ncbi:conserved hypothetical protein [Agrobacterium deltaense NCPPB 1641]|uniref:Uncharacterized protein n=1 Tax=Agrobacterium deltaense NCPPB 1641 TaxID=1183425 RepID=A0A1S7TKL1_9HYPH|nr:conserved hypothetical protein [Agrobacterium deltaense NCPPB 1641]
METGRIENHTLETSKVIIISAVVVIDVRRQATGKCRRPYFFRTSSGFRQSGLRNIIAT